MAKRLTYPPEFRRRIIDLVRSGRSVNSVAAEFQVARQSIMNWMKQEDLDSGVRIDGLTSDERKELAQLRKRVKVLEEEKIILKKAAAWFARETGTIPERSSDS
jgi:transposase